MSEIEKAVDLFLLNRHVKTTCIARGETVRDGWNCDSWSFNINGQSFDYFTGMGHREIVRGYKACRMPGAKMVGGHWQATRPHAPHVAGVLHSVILDSSACGQSFDDWCADYGYDSDSRRALQTYLACQENAAKLDKVFSRADIENLAEILQDY